MLKILTSMFKKGEKDDTLWDATTVIEDENDDGKKPPVSTPETVAKAVEVKKVEPPVAKAAESPTVVGKSELSAKTGVLVSTEKSKEVAPSVAKIEREEARDAMAKADRKPKVGNRGIFGEEASAEPESSSGLKGNRGIFGDEQPETVNSASGLKGNRGIFGDEQQEQQSIAPSAPANPPIAAVQSPAEMLFDGVKDKSEISKKLGALGSQSSKTKLKKPLEPEKKAPAPESAPQISILVAPASESQAQEPAVEPIEQYETGAVCKIILKSDWEDLSVGWDDSVMPKDESAESVTASESPSEMTNIGLPSGGEKRESDELPASVSVGFEAGGAAWSVLGIKESSNHLAIAKSCLVMLCAKGFTMDRLSEDLLDVQTEPSSKASGDGESILSKKWLRMLIAKGVSVEEFAEAMVQIEVEIEEDKLRKIREQNESD